MEYIMAMSNFAVPLMFFTILSYGLTKNITVYDCFVEGAKDGIETVIRILPPLIGLMVAVGVFRESGALKLVIFMLRPITTFLQIPAEVLPLALMRPISGSASLAIVTDLVKQYGPDSLIGKMTSTMMGSTETTFYTLALYFGSVGIKKARHAIVCALLADITGILVSVWICRIIFIS